MIYEKTVRGKFISRPNRFVALVEIEGKTEKCHVKNTGRCKELLIPGAEVIMEDFRGRMGTRKLEYSVVGVFKETEKGKILINMDSQAPNKVVEEALISRRIILPEMNNLKLVKREKTYGDSRFDFYVEDEDGKKGYCEVKGVTLEEDGVVMFPDAPTERGLKHVKGLMALKEEGYYAFVIFIVQMKGVKYFKPNMKTHKAFGDAIKEAQAKKVDIMCFDCNVTEDSLEVANKVEIKI